jgi:excisionase family DNA binding protein
MSEKKDLGGKDVFTTFDAARVCGANIASIKNWIAKGLLKAYRTPGGHYRIRRRDLELFVQKYNMPFQFRDRTTKKVFLVESDRAATKAVQKVMGTGGLTVFKDPVLAGLAVGLERPDIVILDPKSKEYDARALVKALNQQSETCNILVVLLSASLSESERAELSRSLRVEEILSLKAGAKSLDDALTRLL